MGNRGGLGRSSDRAETDSLQITGSDAAPHQLEAASLLQAGKQGVGRSGSGACTAPEGKAKAQQPTLDWSWVIQAHGL